jgi:hypothetical protein
MGDKSPKQKNKHERQKQIEEMEKARRAERAKPQTGGGAPEPMRPPEKR